MKKNTNTLVERKLFKVEVFNLDKKGYGPGGDFTRQAWRDECLKHFKAGAEDFLAWQNSWIEGEININDVNRFDCRIHFDDGSSITPYLEDSHRSSLDFVGQSFNFCNATGFIFLQNAIFAGTYFVGYTSFDEANFNKFATFERAHFEEIAWFNKTVFIEDVLFTKTLFNGDAWFTGAIFKKFAGFVHVRFNGLCNFSDLSGLKKNGLYTSRGVLFEDFANFESSIFENVGHFELAKFNTTTPNFLGVDISKTRLEFSNDDYFSITDVTEAEIKRLGQLKRLADEHGQTDQALMFNKFELNAKREQSRIKTHSLSFLKKLGNSDHWFANATYLYDKFSDFGRSFTRPLKYYAVLLGLVFLIALGNAAYNSPKECRSENFRILSDLSRDDTPCDISETKPDDKIRLNGYRAAAEYTVYRAAGILDFSDNGKATDAVARRLFGQSYEPGWMRFIGLLKAIASTALLFLAALGLRNKYRIK